MFDKYPDAVYLDYFNEPIREISAGKLHSMFLTESGKVMCVGYNAYGQLGLSNSVYVHAEEPVEVFLDGIKVKRIKAGWHHNLL